MAYRGKYPNRIKEVSGRGKSGVVVWTNAGERFEFTARDTGGVMPKPGEEVERYLMPKKNPARTQRAAVGYVNRPSQITKKAPSKRLKKRRTVNLQSPRGVFPNPSPREREFLVKATVAPQFKKPPDDVMYGSPGTSALNAAKNYAGIYLSGYEVIPGGRRMGNKEDGKRLFEIMKFEALNHDIGYGAVVYVYELVSGPKLRKPIKKNPDSVHFDIDVNSHNARGSKAKTRVNPAIRHSGIQVQKEKAGKWVTFATFPKTPDGAKHAIEYAKAYHIAHPTLKLKVME